MHMSIFTPLFQCLCPGFCYCASWCCPVLSHPRSCHKTVSFGLILIPKFPDQNGVGFLIALSAQIPKKTRWLSFERQLDTLKYCCVPICNAKNKRPIWFSLFCGSDQYFLQNGGEWEAIYFFKKWCVPSLRIHLHLSSTQKVDDLYPKGPWPLALEVRVRSLTHHHPARLRKISMSISDHWIERSSIKNTFEKFQFPVINKASQNSFKFADTSVKLLCGSAKFEKNEKVRFPVLSNIGKPWSTVELAKLWFFKLPKVRLKGKRFKFWRKSNEFKVSLTEAQLRLDHGFLRPDFNF